MRSKALIVAAVAALAALVALPGCSSQEPYAPPEATPQVSSPAIGEDGVLRVGVNSQAAPLAGTNSAGDLVGFDVDLAAALADELGLKVEVSDVGADGVSALTDGVVDVVLGVEQDSTDSSSSDQTIWESDPYLQTAVALFAASDSAQVPTAESSPTIAVQTSSTSSWMAENEFGSEALVRSNSLVDAFNQLASGAAGYVAADAVRGTYVVESDGTLSASIVALMQQPSGYCAATLGNNAELQSAVANALTSLRNGGMIDVLDRKWLGTSWDLSSIPLTAGATAQPEKTSEEERAEGKEAAIEETSEVGSNAVTPTEAAAA